MKRKDGLKASELKSTDIIHLWCNDKIKEPIEKSGYRASGNLLFYHGDSIAWKIKIKGKGFIFINSKFDARGSFGTGSDAHDIFRAVPFHKEGYLCNDFITNKKDITPKWIFNEIIKNNEDYFNSIAFWKEFANNNRLSSKNSFRQFKVDDLFTEYLTSKYLKIQNFKVDLTARYKKYYGWGVDNYNLYTTKIECKFKQLLFHEKGLGNYELFLSKSEMEMINFKMWRNSYLREFSGNYNYRRNLKDSFNLYKDDEKRKAWEVTYNSLYQANEREREEKRLKKEGENCLTNLKKLNDWRDGKVKCINIPYEALRIVEGMNGLNPKYVETTQGVSMSLDEAKKAFKLFNRLLEKKETILMTDAARDKQSFGRYNFHSFGIVPITRLDRTKTTLIVMDCYAIKIGCHTIPDFEVEEFLQHFNLKWNEELVEEEVK